MLVCAATTGEGSAAFWQSSLKSVQFLSREGLGLPIGIGSGLRRFVGSLLPFKSTASATSSAVRDSNSGGFLRQS